MTCDLHGKLKFHSLKEVIIGGQKHSIGGKKTDITALLLQRGESLKILLQRRGSADLSAETLQARKE